MKPEVESQSKIPKTSGSPAQSRREVLSRIRSVGLSAGPASKFRSAEKEVGTVLFEDETMLVAAKKEGIPSHARRSDPSLVGSLRLWGHSSKMKLAHRLDIGTSGLLMVAKTKSALLELQKQLASGLVTKKYCSLVIGSWPLGWKGEQLVEVPLSAGSGSRGIVLISKWGFGSFTTVRKAKGLGGWILLTAMPLTGRTHQVRLHCKHIGLPVAGDAKYGTTVTSSSRLMLHSTKLAVVHPLTMRQLTFFSPIPTKFDAFFSNREPRVLSRNFLTI